MNAAPALQRRHRAAVARRLADHEAAAALDWDLLGRAPDWLALPEEDLAAFQRRVGAVFQARAIRLWIDGARIGAAKVALGEGFLARLLALPDSVSIPMELLGVPRAETAAQVAPLLRDSGAAVLLATLSPGALRRAAAALLAPASASSMAAELASTLVERTRSLAAEGERAAA